MQNITNASSFSSTDTQRNTQAASAPVADTSGIAQIPSQESATNNSTNKQLQPDKLALSEEAKAKSAEVNSEENNTKDTTEDKKSFDASGLNNVMTAEEAAAADKANESDLDKRIRELSMEILDLSVQIQMLQDKEDKESVKERQNLEVDLAMKKGELEAAMDRKLQLAALG
jgi:hypothetical protein